MHLFEAIYVTMRMFISKFEMFYNNKDSVKWLFILGGDGGYRSLVDILIATPGRLVDHIQHTPGFTLDKLRYLVIDEADHIMNDSQVDWLAAINTSFYGM